MAVVHAAVLYGGDGVGRGEQLDWADAAGGLLVAGVRGDHGVRVGVYQCFVAEGAPGFRALCRAGGEVGGAGGGKTGGTGPRMEPGAGAVAGSYGCGATVARSGPDAGAAGFAGEASAETSFAGNQ